MYTLGTKDTVVPPQAATDIINASTNKEYIVETNLQEILENQKNWEDKNQKYTTNLTEIGFDYFNDKKYCEEIDNGAFPDFEVIKK